MVECSVIRGLKLTMVTLEEQCTNRVLEEEETVVLAQVKGLVQVLLD